MCAVRYHYRATLITEGAGTSMSCGLYTVTKAEPSRYVDVALSRVRTVRRPPGIHGRTPYPCEAEAAGAAASFGLSNSERGQRLRHTGRGKGVTRKYWGERERETGPSSPVHNKTLALSLGCSRSRDHRPPEGGRQEQWRPAPARRPLRGRRLYYPSRSSSSPARPMPGCRRRSTARGTSPSTRGTRRSSGAETSPSSATAGGCASPSTSPPVSESATVSCHFGSLNRCVAHCSFPLWYPNRLIDCSSCTNATCRLFVSGSGFASQDLFLHGFFSAAIKLPADYAAGVVVAFYVGNAPPPPPLPSVTTVHQCRSY
jgi:hypothetical protein